MEEVEGGAGAGGELEGLEELVADSLGRDAGDGRGGGAEGGEGVGVDVEAEDRGETGGAEEAEMVLGEAAGRVADGSEAAGAEPSSGACARRSAAQNAASASATRRALHFILFSFPRGAPFRAGGHGF